jgi:hypothetical protein
MRLGAARLEVVVADITTLQVDGGRQRRQCGDGGRRRGRRHSSRRRAQTRGRL